MSHWTYVWVDERVAGPMTLTEFRRLEPTLNPDSLVWHPEDGWVPVWMAFAAPEGEESSWPSADSASPPSPPLPPGGTVQERSESRSGRALVGGVSRPVTLLVLVVAVLAGGVLLILGLGSRGADEQAEPNSTTVGTVEPSNEGTPPEEEDIPPEEDVLVISSPGYWTGTMASGQYRFEMTIRERPGGSLRARMTQTSSETGLSGTEFLSGRREANTLRLQGDRWSRGTPAGWSLDTIDARVSRASNGGYRMSGTYTCPTCSGVNDIRGKFHPDF